MNSPERAELLARIEPLLECIARLEPQLRIRSEQVLELEQALARRFPADGLEMRDLGDRLSAGIRSGWLCDRGEANARFSRVAKPSADTHGLSVDVVDLLGTAIEHTHPTGEVTLGFSAEAGVLPSFDGRPPGWVFLPPGSRHVPTVLGGRMHLIYFIPGGTVQWHVPGQTE